MSIARRRGILAAVALAAALVSAGVSATPAAAQPTVAVSGGLTQPVFSYQDAIREYVRVQSPVDSDGDGRKDLVRVDIIRPKETSSGLEVPAIMFESPYFVTPGAGIESEHKTYDAHGNPTHFPEWYDNYFVPRGYAFLSVDMTGTNLSNGCPTSGGPSDVLGGKAVVDWLNGRATAYDANGDPVRATWATGQVGMIGHSYEGSLAMGVAGTGVRGLKTIVPLAGNSSWYDLAHMNGTLLHFKGMQEWIARKVNADVDKTCADVLRRMSEGEDDATGDYNAYWNELDYRTGSVSKVRNVHASVFAVQGLQDQNVPADNFSTWWAGLPRSVHRKVWVTQYGHMEPFYFRRAVWVDSLHKWFDHELMGVPNDIMRQPRADVQLGPDRWITRADWPAPTRTVTLRPHGDGSLGTARSTGTGSYTDTPQAEAATAGDPGTASPYRLAYLTPALQAPLRLSGTPSVSLRVTLDRPAANLGVLLVDYGEDTRINHNGAGWGVKLVDGKDCLGQGTADDDGCFLRTADDTVTSDVEVVTRGVMDAQNRTSLRHSTPLTPGRSYRITWSLLPQDYEVEAGNRLGLVLTGTDTDLTCATTSPACPTTGETGTGAKVTVHLSGTSVSLPLVVGTSGRTSHVR